MKTLLDLYAVWGPMWLSVNTYSVCIYKYKITTILSANGHIYNII